MTENRDFQKFLLGKFYITSILKVETGLHIGGGGENLEIGGLDKGVVRDPITQHPYLPGSSIKGKLRSILERLEGKAVNRHGGSNTYRYESDDLESGFSEVQGQYIPFEGARTCPVSRVFGSTGTICWILKDTATRQRLDILEERDINNSKYAKIKGRNSPARLIVRDCHLRPESVGDLEVIDTGLYMTEWKFENGLDRITAAANPRQVERIPRGSKFDFELIYTVEIEEGKENLDVTEKAVKQAQSDLLNLLKSLLVLEDDALGGHGSRGYGKVRFEHLQFSFQDYQVFADKMNLQISPLRQLQEPLKNTAELPGKFDEIKGLMSGSSSDK